MGPSASSILLDCLGYVDEAAKGDRLAEVSAGLWREIIELAQQQEVAPLLYHRLKRMGLIAIDSENGLTAAGSMELKQAFLENVARNMRLYQELEILLRLFQRQGMETIVLKGACLAEAVYENIGLRMMGDIDLLVRKDGLLRAEQDMLAMGYQPSESERVMTPNNIHFRYTHPKSGLNVEIHWAIVAPNLPYRIDTEDLWRRAQPVTLAQVNTWTLAPADLLLHLCLHTAKHINGLRLRMLCDIDEVIVHFGPELDWLEIGRRAERWGVTHVVYLILRLAQESLGAAIPADWLAALRPAGFNEQYLALARRQMMVLREDDGIGEHAQAVRLWGVKGLSHKMALIRDSLFLSRESMASMYPAPAASWRIYLYYPVRLKDVFLRHSTTLWRLARGDEQVRTAAERLNQITDLRYWLSSPAPIERDR